MLPSATAVVVIVDPDLPPMASIYSPAWLLATHPPTVAAWSRTCTRSHASSTVGPVCIWLAAWLKKTHHIVIILSDIVNNIQANTKQRFVHMTNFSWLKKEILIPFIKPRYFMSNWNNLKICLDNMDPEKRKGSAPPNLTNNGQFHNQNGSGPGFSNSSRQASRNASIQNQESRYLEIRCFDILYPIWIFMERKHDNNSIGGCMICLATEKRNAQLKMSPSHFLKIWWLWLKNKKERWESIWEQRKERCVVRGY